jgi:hypothetical protein
MITLRMLVSAIIAVMAFVPAHGQEKKEPHAKWGSLSGKFIDEKKKPIADAIVFLKIPKGNFPIHADDKVREDLVIQVPAGRKFDFRVLAHFPYYLDGDKKVSTGQKLTLIGDTQQNHIIRTDAVSMLATTDESAKMLRARVKVGDPEDCDLGTLGILAAGENTKLEFKHLAGYRLQSETYGELKIHIFVFDHPYFAITQKDGSFTMPRVPVGTEAVVWAWQEDIGYLLTKAGKKMTFKEGKNTLDVEEKK